MRPVLSMFLQSPEHDQRELDLLSSLLQVLQFTKRLNYCETATLADKASALAEKRNNLPLVVQQIFRRRAVPTENLQIIKVCVFARRPAMSPAYSPLSRQTGYLI